MIYMILGVLIGAVLAAAVATVIHKLYEIGVDAGIVKSKNREGQAYGEDKGTD